VKRHKSPTQTRSRRGNVLAVGGAILAGAALFTVQDLAVDLREANEARDALARQVQQLGGTPVAGKPGSRGDVGPSGVPGRAGTDGKDGKNATPITPRPGASGAPGKPGADSTVPGRSGEPGRPGVDSTVPGPTGPAGQPGADSTVPGPQGERGEKGDTGDTGTAGPAGQSCETGYSWQTPEYDPDARICRRDGAPPPEDPNPAPPQGPSVGLPADRRRS
jgi:hypothetical protein